MKRLALLVLLAGCATHTPTAVPRGEARPAVGPSSTPPPTAAPLVTERQTMASKASRSRRPRSRVGAGSLLDTTCYAWTGNRTASGKWPRVGMAAGPWPFGTRLLVQGVGVVTVEDRYGHSTQLDIFGPSEAFCRRFGRRHLRVVVLP